MSSGRGLVCPLCSQEHTAHLGFTLREYLQHINLFHAHQPGFQVICGIGSRTFSNFRTFENHISSYHRGESHTTNQVNGVTDESPRLSGSISESTGNLECGHAPEVLESHSFQRSSALFLLHPEGRAQANTICCTRCS